MDTTKNNGIVLATLIITMIVLSIILSITVTFTLKNPSLQQLLPGIRKRNIEKIYQEQLDARIQQEKFTGNEETDNNRVHQIITEIVQQEHTIVGEIPKYTTGFEHDYTFTIQEKNKNVKTEITLKSKPELNNALQQVSMDSGYTKTPPLPEVGDTVIYDPTKGVLDQSKLTYTSQKGTAKTGGNGHDTQTVTAKSNQNEWIVLSTANNQIKVISKEPIGDVSGGKKNLFTLRGGIGWLYAEEELHKACSIYGYGKGADKSKKFNYQIGNYQIPGEAQTRTITGSGARSITMEDIVKIMKGEVYTDFTDAEKKGFNSHYMYLKSNVIYPTTSSDNVHGMSTTIKTITYDFYHIGLKQYRRYLVPDIEVEKNKVKLAKYIYVDNRYFISSRFLVPRPVPNYLHSPFCIGQTDLDLSLNYEANDFEYGLTQRVFPACYLRPVVYLDASMVKKQSDGVWKIKD